MARRTATIINLTATVALLVSVVVLGQRGSLTDAPARDAVATASIPAPSVERVLSGDSGVRLLRRPVVAVEPWVEPVEFELGPFTSGVRVVEPEPETTAVVAAPRVAERVPAPPAKEQVEPIAPVVVEAAVPEPTEPEPEVGPVESPTVGADAVATPAPTVEVEADPVDDEPEDGPEDPVGDDGDDDDADHEADDDAAGEADDDDDEADDDDDDDEGNGNGRGRGRGRGRGNGRGNASNDD